MPLRNEHLPFWMYMKQASAVLAIQLDAANWQFVNAWKDCLLHYSS